MIQTILSDFSYVILYPKDKNYQGTLNGLYKELLSKNKPFNFFDYFVLDEGVLDLYSELKKKYTVNMFTSGYIQNAPEVKAHIEDIFENVYSAEELGLRKKEPNSYNTIAGKLNQSTNSILFIDDQGENIAAAYKAGMSTILFSDFKEFRTRIKEVLFE